MRFSKSLILSALAAVSLMTTSTAHAKPNAPQSNGALPNLMVGRTKPGNPTMVYIRNAGLGGSDICHVRIQLENGGVFYFAIWRLQPREEVGFQMPAAKDGKPYSFTVTVDCEREVAETNEDDNVEQIRCVS